MCCSLFNVSLSDILGSEELHPKHLLYHVPNYLKGVHKAEKHFQVRVDTCEVLFLGKLILIFSSKIQLRRHKALEHTKFPDAFPSKWQGWRLTVSEEKAFSDRLTGQYFRWLKIIDG